MKKILKQSIFILIIIPSTCLLATGNNVEKKVTSDTNTHLEAMCVMKIKDRVNGKRFKMSGECDIVMKHYESWLKLVEK